MVEVETEFILCENIQYNIQLQVHYLPHGIYHTLSGVGISKAYLPIMVPIGIIGNSLSFMVSLILGLLRIIMYLMITGYVDISVTTTMFMSHSIVEGQGYPSSQDWGILLTRAGVLFMLGHIYQVCLLIGDGSEA